MDTENETTLSPREEQYVAKVEEAQISVDEFEASVTQREWLLVCNKLDKTRAEIRRDGSLRLLALGWVREKREHGGASWDKLLEMTDRQLLDLHGYPSLDEDAEPEPTPEPVEDADGDA